MSDRMALSHRAYRDARPSRERRRIRATENTRWKRAAVRGEL